MKNHSKVANLLMFVIALISIQNTFTLQTELEASTATATVTATAKDPYCILNKLLVKKNYIKKIRHEVNRIFRENNWDESFVCFNKFRKFFEHGTYGKIAHELAGDRDYVKSYYQYFSDSHDNFGKKEFRNFYALYYLEGELLVAGKHPTLSNLFPNSKNVNKKRACRVALAYWELVNIKVKKLENENDWDDETEIKRRTFAKLLVQSKLGICLAKVGKDSLFFDLTTAKYLGFFNMSGGIRRGLTLREFRLAYSSFYWIHITHKCNCNEKPEPKAPAPKVEKPKEEPGI